MDRNFIEFFHKPRSKKYKCVMPEMFMSNREKLELPPARKLNHELRELYNILRPKYEEVLIREYLLKNMVELLQNGIEDVTVSTFGSYKCEIFLSTSDFDIIIDHHKKLVSDKSLVLKKAKDLIYKSEFINDDSIIHLSRARIPILRCRDSIFNYKFDISVGQFNGIEQARYIKKTLSDRPYIKPFVLLLKYFLKVRDLSESKRGGLCSYAQFLMILHFFQLHPLVQLGCIDPFDNMGVLLLDFFQYYGFNFHFRSKLVLEDVGYKRKDDDSVIFSIEDPLNKDHDVGSLCTNGHAIMDVFNHTYRIMSLVFRNKVEDNKSLSSLWMKANSAEEIWRERNIAKWKELQSR